MAAAWLGGRAYPQRRLNDAWFLVLSGQFHDVAAGTATPRAYEFAWNDDVIALNQFAGVLTSAVQGPVASTMDTNVEGILCVVYKPTRPGSRRCGRGCGSISRRRALGGPGRGSQRQGSSVTNLRRESPVRRKGAFHRICGLRYSTGEGFGVERSCALRRTRWKTTAIGCR